MKTSETIYIDVAHVKYIIESRQKINRYDLADCIFILEDGTLYAPSDKTINEWKFIGLNNIDFIYNEVINETTKTSS